MARGAATVTVKITGDASNFNKVIGESEDRLGTFGSKVSSAIGSLGKIAAVGAGAVGGLAVAVGKQAVDAFMEAEKIGAQTEAVIKSTGGAANVTAKQVDDLANKMAMVAGVMDDEAVKAGENLLLTFTNVQNRVGDGNDIFNQATATMVDMSIALGQDATQSAIQLGKALNDPIRGITALRKVGVSFTQAQEDQIRALQESGDVMGAQKIILAELNKEFGGSAEAAGGTLAGALGKLKVTWGNLLEQVGEKFAPVIKDIAQWMGDHLPAAFEKASDWVEKRLPDAIEKAKGAFETMRDVLGRVRDAIGWVADNWEWLGPVTVGLGAAVTTIWAINTAVQAWTAAQAALNIVMAANPIGAVIVALAALAAGLIYAYEHSERFRNIIDAVVDTIQAGFNKALSFATEVLRQIANNFLLFAETFLGAADKAFSWVPGIGPKLQEAHKAVAQFRDDVNARLSETRDKFDITAQAHTAQAIGELAGLKQAIQEVQQFAAQGIQVQAEVDGRIIGHGGVLIGTRASGGPVTAGSPYLVGEQGPELMVPRQSGRIVPNGSLAAAGGPQVVIQSGAVQIAGNADPAVIDRALGRLTDQLLRQFRAWGA